MCGWWQSSRHFVHVTSRHFANLRIHSSLCCPSIDSFPCDLSVCLSVIKFQRMLSSCRPLALASFNNFFLLLLLTMDHGGGFRRRAINTTPLSPFRGALSCLRTISPHTPSFRSFYSLGASTEARPHRYVVRRHRFVTETKGSIKEVTERSLYSDLI